MGRKPGLNGAGPALKGWRKSRKLTQRQVAQGYCELRTWQRYETDAIPIGNPQALWEHVGKLDPNPPASLKQALGIEPSFDSALRQMEHLVLEVEQAEPDAEFFGKVRKLEQSLEELAAPFLYPGACWEELKAVKALRVIRERLAEEPMGLEGRFDLLGEQKAVCQKLKDLTKLQQMDRRNRERLQPIRERLNRLRRRALDKEEALGQLPPAPAWSEAPSGPRALVKEDDGTMRWVQIG